MILFIEGIPGSGKTTFTNKLKDYFKSFDIDVKSYNEGELQPIDLAWCAIMDKSTYQDLLSTYSSYRTQIEAQSKPYKDQMITAYTKISVDPIDHDFYDTFAAYEIYRSNDFAYFKNTHIELWSSFEETSDITIFESIFLQNHINELLLKFNCREAEMVQYFDDLWDSLKGVKHLIYIHQKDIDKTISHVVEERRSPSPEQPDWIDLVIEYFAKSMYGTKKNYLGYDGALRYFKDRQAIELRYLSSHPDTTTIIDLDTDYEVAFQKLIDSPVIQDIVLDFAFEVRELTPTERSMAQQLFVSVFSKEPWKDDWSEESQLQQYMSDLMDNNNSKSFGLFYQDELIALSLGYLFHWYQGKEYFIKEFCVATSYQRQGVGQLFIKAIKTQLHQEKVRAIWLLTERNTGAYSFYEKNGFQQSKETVLFASNTNRK